MWYDLCPRWAWRCSIQGRQPLQRPSSAYGIIRVCNPRLQVSGCHRSLRHCTTGIAPRAATVDRQILQLSSKVGLKHGMLCWCCTVDASIHPEPPVEVCTALMDCRSSRHPGSMAQWAWAQDSPRKGPLHSATPRVLLMVREAVLLNSLKRLMVAVPIYEASINRWSGGHAAPPGPISDMSPEFSGYEDVAPCVGAQFAQVWLLSASACAETPPTILRACAGGLLMFSWLYALT